MTPLHKAKTGEIIKMLVAAGADVKLAHEASDVHSPNRTAR